MGILNVTSDSFFDGGKYLNQGDAFKRACRMVEEGADIIDVGGESTRPGVGEVPAEKEIKRVIPVIEKIKKELNVKISCDTSKYEVAERALEAGADMINDVRGFRDPEMRRVACNSNAAICIMHMQGNPRTMQNNPVYKDVISEIKDFLYTQAEICKEDSINTDNIIIDPGIGFGKTLEHNLKILANIELFDKYPVMVGASRKSFLEKLLNAPVEERLPGSLSAAAYCALKNVSILRVHDVKPTKDVVKAIKALKEKEDGCVFSNN